MPLEIREIVIRASVVAGDETTNKQAKQNANAGDSSNQDVVQACLEKIMESQNDKDER